MRAPLPLLFLLTLVTPLGSACSLGTRPDAPGPGDPRTEASCLPDQPDCPRVLPGVGTYRATIRIEVKATSVPPAPAGGTPDEWTPAEMELVQQESVVLRRDAKGNIQGIRELADEDGIHFVFVEPKFCIGLRYEPAVCRDADEGEVTRRVAELAGTWREVLGWVKDRVRWESDGRGGQVLRAVKGAPEAGPTRVVDVQGTFRTDPATGEHRVQVRYLLAGTRPDAVGYTLQVQYEHVVSGTAEPVTLPADALHHAGRLRPLMDRKALLGDPTPTSLRHLYLHRTAD